MILSPDLAGTVWQYDIVSRPDWDVLAVRYCLQTWLGWSYSTILSPHLTGTVWQYDIVSTPDWDGRDVSEPQTTVGRLALLSCL